MASPLAAGPRRDRLHQGPPIRLRRGNGHPSDWCSLQCRKEEGWQLLHNAHLQEDPPPRCSQPGMLFPRHLQGSLSFLGFLLQHHLSERPLPEQHSPPSTGCLCICCERGPCWDVSPSKSRLTSFTAVSSAAAAKPAAGQPRSGGFVECTKEQTPDRRSALGRWDGVCLTHSHDPRHRAWFRMKCHLCVNYIEMQTDPANCDYVIVSGAQRKEERWDMEDNEQVLTTEHEKKQKLETDAMFRLEHGEADRSTLKKALPTLSHIQEAQSAWKDDFALNSMLRKRFRVAPSGEPQLCLQQTLRGKESFELEHR
ncbi:probable splicing factor YJU2B isoform X4 [Acinonyx jubatus]|uniref:Probable splicing factor YJU2B n=1 Tax=Acinonyx jubatus TaxID=32536 RepID=A0ABM3PVR2_ACIJB|nr:probable splicing factor YJU2B isoform X4 [Acinonyx jubatus]